MTIINQQIENFRQFLISAWPHVDNLMENHDWHDDGDFLDQWVQVNWEFLVERELLGPNQFLSPFEFVFLRKRRVTHPNSTPNYAIICKPKENSLLIDDKTKNPIPDNLTLIFQGLGKKIQTSCGLYPPFDYANLIAFETKALFNVFIHDLDFHLEKIDLIQKP